MWVERYDPTVGKYWYAGVFTGQELQVAFTSVQSSQLTEYASKSRVVAAAATWTKISKSQDESGQATIVAFPRGSSLKVGTPLLDPFERLDKNRAKVYIAQTTPEQPMFGTVYRPHDQ